MNRTLLLEQDKTQPKQSMQVFSEENQIPTKIISYDAVLKKAFEENPRHGIELLFNKYYVPLCSHAVRFVYSKQIAEDLVSEVFYQFYKTQSHQNIKTSYVSYLFTAVRNEAFTYIKKEFGKTDSIDLSNENLIKNSAPLPDAEVHYNQLFLKINEAIEQLPTQCQKVFLLNRFENKRYNEIAEELNISPKTVEVHISKALKYLRNMLQNDWILTLFLFLSIK